MKHFIDNSVAPIIAIDFDGTICMGNSYPDPNKGVLRPYAKEVINFLYDIGAKVVIWTNRKNIQDTDIKDKLLMKEWLNEQGINYHTVNDSTEFAPFKYYGRKLYAHMFVDDRGYGWTGTYDIMVNVLEDFLYNIVGVSNIDVHSISNYIRMGKQPPKESINHIKYLISNWNNGDTNV